MLSDLAVDSPISDIKERIEVLIESIHHAENDDEVIIFQAHMGNCIKLIAEKPEDQYADLLPKLLDCLVALLRDSVHFAVLSRAIRMINDLFYLSENAKVLEVSQQAIVLLLGLLSNKDQLILEDAARSIANFVVGSKERSDFVFQMGGIRCLKPLLLSQDEETRCYATAALASLAECSDEARRGIHQHKMIPLFVKLLEYKSGDVLTKLEFNAKNEAARALGNLAYNSDNIIKSILEAKAIPALVRLLNAKHEEVETNAIFALSNLAQHSDNSCVAIYREDVIPTLVKQLSRPDLEAKQYAVLLIHRLAHQSDEIRQALIGAKVKETLKAVSADIDGLEETVRHTVDALTPLHADMRIKPSSILINPFFPPESLKKASLENDRASSEQDHGQRSSSP